MPIDGIRRAFRRTGRDASTDVSDELAFHFARRVDDLVARGMSPDAARAEAVRAFGDVDHVRREMERMTRSPDKPFICSSTGAVISRSTSSAAWRSVKDV